MGRYLKAFFLVLLWCKASAEAANVHPTPVATATPQPTPTPLAFGTPGVVAIFGSPELQPYAGATCPTPGMVTAVNASGAVTCATPVPTATVVPTPTPGSGGGFTNSARVTNSGVQSISDNTLTAITFDTEDFDNGSMHSTVTNTSRLTAPSTGYYVTTCQLSFASNSTGIRHVFIRKNGSTYISDGMMVPISGGVTRLATTTFINLSATDYVECVGYQNSGGSLNTEVQSDYVPIFTAEQVQ